MTTHRGEPGNIQELMLAEVRQNNDLAAARQAIVRLREERNRAEQEKIAAREELKNKMANATYNARHLIERAKKAEAERDAYAELAAGKCVIQKVIDQLGPQTLISVARFHRMEKAEILAGQLQDLCVKLIAVASKPNSELQVGEIGNLVAEFEGLTSKGGVA